jgi:hypothetical protein
LFRFIELGKVERMNESLVAFHSGNVHSQGYSLLQGAVGAACLDAVIAGCESAMMAENNAVLARSSRGHVYAARNLIDHVVQTKTIWRTGIQYDFLRQVLGQNFGLVRVLFFDKPPDRTWSLPWHKDTAIAVVENRLPSQLFTRRTIKADVPHVIAPDDILKAMLTLRIHLDEVTTENGPLQVVPESHHSSDCTGVGVERAETILAARGDVLAMRPLLSHASGSSKPETLLHRRILHLEFAAHRDLPDNFQWHRFIASDDRN